MRKIKFGILIILMAIGGVALFQVGNVCAAEDVLEDVTIQVPSHKYRDVCSIGPIVLDYEKMMRGYMDVFPVYKQKTAWDPNEDQYMQYKPIDLLILDSINYKKFERGEKFEHWGQLGIINGTYYFHYPNIGGVRDISSPPPYTVIIGNSSEQPLYAHIRIVRVK